LKTVRLSDGLLVRLQDCLTVRLYKYGRLWFTPNPTAKNNAAEFFLLLFHHSYIPSINKLTRRYTKPSCSKTLPKASKDT